MVQEYLHIGNTYVIVLLEIGDDFMAVSTKQIIIDAALKLFSERGFNDVSVNEIIKQVGLSKRTFYYHFDSKEDILEDFYNMPNEITLNMFASMLDQDSNLEKLFALYRPRIEHFMHVGKNISKQLVISNLTDNKGTFKFDIKLANKIKMIELDLIVKAQSEKEITNMATPKQLSKILLNNLVGHILLWLINDTDCTDLVVDIENDAKIILGVVT